MKSALPLAFATIVFGMVLRAETRPAYSDALDAVAGLQSITKDGSNYFEYSKRTLDARVIVDRLLSKKDVPVKVRSEIKIAMDLYSLASHAWAVKINKGDYADFGKEATRSFPVGACMFASEVVANVIAASGYPKDNWRAQEAVGMSLADAGPQIFWRCAEDRVNKARELVASDQNSKP